MFSSSCCHPDVLELPNSDLWELPRAVPGDNEPFPGDNDEPQPAVSLLLAPAHPQPGNDLLPGFPTPLVLQLFHLTPTCSSAWAALCCFTAFPSTPSLRGNCRKKTSAKMFYFHPWPAQRMQIQARRACAHGRARPWLPAVWQYRGNNVHSSNAELIHAVSCFSRSI